MFKMLMPGKNYRFSVINFRTSLHAEANDIPIAVLVESDDSIVVVGYDPDLPQGVSDVARDVIANFPNALEGLLAEAEGPPGEITAIDLLRSQNRWSLYLSPAEEIKSPYSPFELAFALFRRFVSRNLPWPEGKSPSIHRAYSSRENIYEVGLPTPSSRAQLKFPVP